METYRSTVWRTGGYLVMGKFIDLSGKQFGRLLVIKRYEEEYISPKGYKNINWLCQCECGNTVIVRGCNLKSGASTSCGCLRKEHPNRTTHGGTGTRLYNIWTGMIRRCTNIHDRYYERYGGRGIKVCDEWRNSFEIFREWAYNNGYLPNLSIDRIDNDGDYNPENCRWTDMQTQQNNKSNNHYITFNGKTMTMSQWAREVHIGYQKLKDRLIKCGWTVQKALTTK